MPPSSPAASATRRTSRTPAAPPTIPMSDAAIEAKFLANATPVIGAERAKRAGAFVWSLESSRTCAS